MFEAFDHAADFVRDNAVWAPPIVFALAFAESLAFISLLLPAWGALVAIGALVGAGTLELLAGVGRRARSARPSATGCPTGSASSSNTPSRTCGRCRGIPT